MFLALIGDSDSFHPFWLLKALAISFSLPFVIVFKSNSRKCDIYIWEAIERKKAKNQCKKTE